METMTVRTPWHLWVVGVVAVLWNAFGATDFLMTMVNRDAWFEMLKVKPEDAAMIATMPAWTFVAWAAGTWGALLGALALLFRSRWAVAFFGVSLAGLAASLVYAYGLSDAGAASGQDGMMRYALITAGALFFLWYAWTMRKRGVLR